MGVRRFVGAVYGLSGVFHTIAGSADDLRA